MRIGFSLGRCIRDIVNGDVDIDEVAFIIAGTYITEKEQLAPVLAEYTYHRAYLQGLDLLECTKVAEKLWDLNKILQPRRQGLQRHLQPEDAIWVDIFPTKISNNSAVKQAWENYRVLLNMIENVNTDTLEVFR